MMAGKPIRITRPTQTDRQTDRLTNSECEERDASQIGIQSKFASYAKAGRAHEVGRYGLNASEQVEKQCDLEGQNRRIRLLSG